MDTSMGHPVLQLVGSLKDQLLCEVQVYSMYIVPRTWLTPVLEQKRGLFLSKQGSIGFQVYTVT